MPLVCLINYYVFSLGWLQSRPAFLSRLGKGPGGRRPDRSTRGKGGRQEFFLTSRHSVLYLIAPRVVNYSGVLLMVATLNPRNQVRHFTLKSEVVEISRSAKYSSSALNGLHALNALPGHRGRSKYIASQTFTASYGRALREGIAMKMGARPAREGR